MLGETRRRGYAGPCAIVLIGALIASAIPARAVSKDVDMNGDGVDDSTVVVTVLQTWPPLIQNSVFNNSGSNRLFSWINAGPGGFTSNAPNDGEIRWTWQTAQTVFSFTGSVCRNDMCTFNRDGSRVGGAFGVPGRTVVAGQATSSTGALTSSLIQSFSPGDTLLSCTSSVERLENGNYAYTITCTNSTGEPLEFEIDAQPLDCCEGTDAEGNPNQLRCDVDVVVVEDDPNTEEDETEVGTESQCLDYLTDNDNCGDCGNECADDEICSVGQCAAICPVGTQWCGLPHDPDSGGCFDLSADPENCGACGEICGPTQATGGDVEAICVEGECEFCTLGARNECGNECVDLDSDFENCGACGNSCAEECPGGGICEEGRSCVCDEDSKRAVGPFTRVADDYGQSYLRTAEAAGRQAGTAKDFTGGDEGLPVPPAPLCTSPATTLVVPDGGAITECFASPNLPMEIEGRLQACGGLIPEGSPLCGDAFGSAGIFQQYAPTMLLPDPVEFSLIDVQITDGDDGNGLIEPGDTACFTVTVASAGTDTLTSVSAELTSPPIDLVCGQIIRRECVPDDDDLSTVDIIAGSANFPDELVGIAQTDPDNNSCFDGDGNPLPRAELFPSTNDMEFCVTVPIDHPEDLVRPFMLQFTGLDGQGQPFEKEVTFALGIGSICDFSLGDFPDQVAGPGAGLAPMVPVEAIPPLPLGTVTGGTLLDLGVALGCGGGPVTDEDIEFGARVVGLTGQASGDFTPADDLFVYNPATETWEFDLDTSALPPDTWNLRLRVSDVKDYHTRFETCDDTDVDGFNDCEEECDDDPSKQDPGICGCGVADTDSDEDGFADCEEECDDDPDKQDPGICGCGVADTDSDEDGFADCEEECDDDPNKQDPGICGCGIADTDSDEDGFVDCEEECDDDPNKQEPGTCGCGVADTDSDEDGFADCEEECDDDPNKQEPGTCGCGVADTDSDEDGFADCEEECDDDPNKQEPGTCGCGVADTDSDDDGFADCEEECDDDPNKQEPGTCGCGVADTDSDEDGFADCEEECDDDPNKQEPGTCGCGVADTDSDEDGFADCEEECDDDPNKQEPGTCGCGVADTDSDEDGFADCEEECDDDPNKQDPGICGCGIADTDSDEDGVADCEEECDDDPNKQNPGICGCGVADTDSDEDGFADCEEECDDDPNKQEPGTCGCGVADTDTDGDGFADCEEECDDDPNKQEPGTCGCGVADTDTDGDGFADCEEECDDDPNKQEPGTCGCGVADTDSDGDGFADCEEACDDDPDKQEPGICGCGRTDDDTDGDGTANCNDECPLDENKIEPQTCGCGTAETDTDGDGAPDCIDPCGNGVLDPGEECDDGNQANDDGCRNTCEVAFDGDDDDDDDDGHIGAPQRNRTAPVGPEPRNRVKTKAGLRTDNTVLLGDLVKPAPRKRPKR